jgi:hypothetical protein
MNFVGIVDDDIAGFESRATIVMCRRMVLGQKTNHRSAGLETDGTDLRQVQVIPQHAEPVEFDLRDIGLEFSSFRRECLKITTHNGTAAKQGVPDIQHPRPRHFGLRESGSALSQWGNDFCGLSAK